MSKVKCMICGYEGDLLSNHIRTHGINKYEYRELYTDSKLISEEYSNKLSDKTKEQWRDERFRDIVISSVKASNERNRDILIQRMKDINERQLIDKDFKDYCSMRRSLGQSNSWKKDWVRNNRVLGMKKSFKRVGYTNKQWDKLRSLDTYQPYKRGVLNGTSYKSSWERYFIEFLLTNSIKYIYESNYFKYIDINNKVRKYYPDFYLSDYDIYVEIHPKNLLYDSFMKKISVVPNLLLLTEDELFSDNLLDNIKQASIKWMTSIQATSE